MRTFKYTNPNGNEVLIQLEEVNLKEYYLKAYPEDVLGQDMNDEYDTADLMQTLLDGYDVYSIIGVPDSIIRERLFGLLEDVSNLDYNEIYLLWLYR